jgi:hypothetical protein
MAKKKTRTARRKTRRTTRARKRPTARKKPVSMRKPVRRAPPRRRKAAHKKAINARKARKKTTRGAARRRRTRTEATLGTPVSVHGLGPDSAGQSGDIQGLPEAEVADSESVEELAEEGQAFEAELIDAVENAPEGEVRTREVPEDDVPEEYLDEED